MTEYLEKQLAIVEEARHAYELSALLAEYQKGMNELLEDMRSLNRELRRGE